MAARLPTLRMTPCLVSDSSGVLIELRSLRMWSVWIASASAGWVPHKILHFVLKAADRVQPRCQ